MLINEKHKIETDNINTTLYEKVRIKKTGGFRWQPIAYFSNFKNALKYLVEQGVMGTRLKDFQAVVEKQDELYQLINGLKIT